MKITEQERILNQGITVTLRSPKPEEAGAFLDHMKRTMGETEYLLHYPEEMVRTEEEQAKVLKDLLEAEDCFMIAAYLNHQIIAVTGLQKFGTSIKFRHRANFVICIQKQFWGLGLGTVLMETLMQEAHKTNLEYLDLGVLADNVRAVSLYRKMGFLEWGCQPAAFKMKDGTCHDELHMSCSLRKDSE